MKTRLESLIGYLAGRQGDAVDHIRLELEDPSSDASRWLAEVRSRSRALFSPGSLEQPAVGLTPAVPRFTSMLRPAHRRWLPPFALGASAATLLLLVVGALLQARDDRLNRLETLLSRQDARLGNRLERIETAVTAPRPPSPAETPSPRQTTSQEDKPAREPDATTALTLARLETKLGQLGERLSQEAPKQEMQAPSSEPLRVDIERLRREIELGSETSKKQIQELSTVLREVLHLLKRLNFHSRSSEPIQVPVPVPVPMPQGREPGLGQRPATNGSGTGQLPGQLLMQGQVPNHQRWGSLSSPGGHMGHGTQTPGGPG